MEDEIKLKEPRTFEEQLEILKDKHMKIDNDDKAINVLKITNYYRLTAYALQFNKNDDYAYKISFTDMYKLYEFDKALRSLILDILEDIEIAFRTYMAYSLSIKYGTEAYKNSDLFKDERFYNGYDDVAGKHHKGLIDEIKLEIHNNRKELFVKHHLIKYKGRFPIWVLVEIFSFGMLSRTYSNLNTADQKDISRNCFNINNQLLESWAENLSYIRNICAHYGRLYNKKMAIIPKLHNRYNEYKESINSNRLFISILGIKELTKNGSKWGIFQNKLKKLLNEYKDVIDLRLIGFPENWVEILSK
ncbi:Abi family protein [Clostridium ljungdahlii]|uniref:Abi-like protein n=1 Tax=Clostridium ljungdahlii (strain ATCC 55383 / DSM 13528 / PETC) TaxID=748727 RepID=D8GR15_CLOLD|nr:Abi family protein [Clostridium ljungdahlii]ADK16320.1 AbiF-like protein [Clostridium ljungdahlii DSM 13528]OAA89807.1 Abi-like protein [Clostridium ljungdahlii DSM 13528]